MRGAPWRALDPRAFGATNEPGTCLWCGRKLRAYPFRQVMVDDGLMTQAEANQARGAYADGRFCGLRCGFAFAVTVANLGHRLAPPGPTEQGR